MDYNIFVTEPTTAGTEEGKYRDPLGFIPIRGKLMEKVLPGLILSTRYLKYYTFLALLYQDKAFMNGNNPDYLENILAYANCVEDYESTRVGGKKRYKNIKKDGLSKERVSIIKDHLTKYLMMWKRGV